MTNMLPLEPSARDDLAVAFAVLQRPNLLAKFLALLGEPVDGALSALPPLAGRDSRRLIDLALLKCLETAITSLRRPSPFPHERWASTMMTGIIGGIGGFFGPIALPFELVVTSILLFRGIGAIAAEQGEDLSRPETWLACMEVIALGTMRFDRNASQNYYDSRTTLSALPDHEAVQLLKQHLGEASTLVMTRVTGDILVRVLLVLSGIAASGAVPLVGAATGFSVTAIFMDHFQRIADGHFTIRRLERRHGRDRIREEFQRLMGTA